MIGALIMAVLRNGSNQSGWPTYMQEIIIGIVIILARLWTGCVNAARDDGTRGSKAHGRPPGERAGKGTASEDPLVPNRRRLGSGSSKR